MQSMGNGDSIIARQSQVHLQGIALMLAKMKVNFLLGIIFILLIYMRSMFLIGYVLGIWSVLTFRSLMRYLERKAHKALIGDVDMDPEHFRALQGNDFIDNVRKLSTLPELEEASGSLTVFIIKKEKYLLNKDQFMSSKKICLKNYLLGIII